MSNQKDISQYIGNPERTPFLIGIGGVSMCSLAETLLATGCTVKGSDFKESETVERLRKQGITVNIGHNAENITQVDYIIRSAAIHDDNPEIVRARELGIPVFERAQGWGAVMRQYRSAVCVAGTHGKTSTTSMFTHVALAGETDPTVMIGGDLPILGSGHRVGESKEVIVLESCEYCNSFLHFFPTVAVILNVEADHLDFFQDLEDVKHSFREFALRTPEGTGVVVANADDGNTMDCLADLPRKVVTFGVENQATYRGVNIVHQQGTVSFDVEKNGELLVHIQLLVPGKHNILNALAVVAAAHCTGISVQAIAKGLASYVGVGRRFELKGNYGGAVIYDDYAHHPSEIKALFDAVEQMEFERIIVVFQPHTYTRTHAFFDQFAEQLSRPDMVILADIFAAREQNTLGISSADLAAKIEGCYYIPDFDEIVRFLKNVARPGDCILTVGAGELNKVSAALAAETPAAKHKDTFDYGVEDGGLRDISEVKILICYLLQTVGGTLPRHLLDEALQSDGLCSFWTVSQGISQLLENEMIVCRETREAVSYTVTEQGKACAAELETAIPLAVRERAVKRAAALLAKAKAATQTQIQMEKGEEGYLVSLSVPDGNRELFTLRLSVADSLQAHYLKEKFLEDPAKIYRDILKAFDL